MSYSNEAFCLFCYKSFDKSKSEQSKDNDDDDDQSLEEELSKELQNRFFRLLNRHLQENKTSSLTKLKLKEFELGNVLLQCPDCSSLLQSYCNYFEEIEVLKLKLNWRLEMLVRIVSGSEKVKSRRLCFEQKIYKRCQGFEDKNEALPQDLLQSVKRLRNEVVQKCKRILRFCPPQVRLQNYTESRVPKLEGGTEMVNSRSCTLNGSEDFEREQIEDTFVPPVKLENGQHSSAVQSTSPTNFTDDGDVKDRIVIAVSAPEASKSESAPHSEINVHEFRTSNDDPNVKVVYEQVGEARGREQVKVIHSDCPSLLSCNDISASERSPDTLFEEHFEGPVASAKIENQEQCSEEEEIRVPEEAVQDKEMKSSKAEENESKTIVEPGGQSKTEPTGHRFSLRTRHKCSKCSVGFTSASNLKLHLHQCGEPEPETTLDKKSDYENINGDDDDNYDDLGGGDNCSEDDKDAEISEPDSSHLSEAESNAGTEDEGERDSGRKRKLTTPPPVPKRSKYEFFETKLNCEVEDCKFYFYKQSDLDNHSKLHGEFKCAFCDVTETYAPDLSVHELSHKVKLELTRNGLVKQEQSQPVQCPRCTSSKVQFRDLKDYSKHHLEAHLNLKPNVHACPVCEWTFPISTKQPSFSSEVMVHFRANHDLHGVPEAEVKRCHHDGCSAYFLHYSQLVRHRLAVHIEGGKDNCKGPFVCTICDESFISKKSFMKHRVNTHKVGLPVPCDDPCCNERFENELYMNQHLVFGRCVSSEVKALKDPQVPAGKCVCLVCGYFFGTASKLGQHLDRAHPQFKAEAESEAKLGQNRSQVQCLVCKAPLKIGGLKDPSKAFLMIKQHFKWHHDLKDLDLSSPSVLNCNVGDCKAYFLRQTQLRVHQKRDHFNGKCKCASCGYSAKRFCELKNHRVMVHKVELNFACSHEGCDERCETQADLDYHIDLAHYESGSRWRKRKGSQALPVPALVCDTCGKRFKQLSGLKAHLKTHVPKEPHRFICPECGKVFQINAKLQLHLLCHAGPESWRFTCETCGKKCLNKHKLEEHQNVHSKTKPFTCEYCGLDYAHRHNFRHHLKDKHDVILEKVHWSKTTISVGNE